MSLNETAQWKRVGSGTTSKHIARVWNETDDETKGKTCGKVFVETCYKRNEN
jgi:hypothetical protein